VLVVREEVVVIEVLLWVVLLVSDEVLTRVEEVRVKRVETLLPVELVRVRVLVSVVLVPVTVEVSVVVLSDVLLL
jgi:hypothetical protein